MKKLMIALAAAATTMFSFGDLPTGTSFEGLATGDKTVTDIVDNDDAGTTDGTLYWFSTADGTDDLGVVTNEAPYTGTMRPQAYKDASNANYLTLDTSSTPLYRTINGKGNASAIADVEGTEIGDGLYLDTLVKFTAADSTNDLQLAEGDKIAISYVVEDMDDDEDGVYLTNFVVRAGYVNGSGIDQKNYVMDAIDDFDITVWHRLTVRAISNVGSSAAPVGFVVYVDGEALTYSTDVAAGDAAYVESLNAAVAQNLYNSGKHALLPSTVNSGSAKTTLSAVAFKGSGSIDDISFTQTKPEFIDEGMAVTIAWDAGVETVKIGADEAFVTAGLDYTATNITVASGVTSLAVTATPADGKEIGEWTASEGTFADGTWSGFVSGATLTIKSMTPLFKVGDKNYGDFKSALAEAVKAAAEAGTPATIQLLADYTGDITFEEGDIILDLAGNTLTGSDTATIMNIGANLLITNSTATVGHIDPGTLDYAILISSGLTQIYAGSVDGMIEFDTEEDPTELLKLYGGYYVDVNSATTVEAFYLNDYAKATVTYTGADSYFLIGDNSESEPTEIDVPTAVSGLVYDGTVLTGVAEGTGYTLSGNTATDAGNYTATATLADGYVWTGGSTEAQTINWLIAAKTDATVVVTLTSEIAEYSAQLEFPTASAKIGGDDVAGTPAWDPATISEPEAGATNTYTVTFTVTTANYAGSKGTATFKVYKEASSGGWEPDPSEIDPAATAAETYSELAGTALATANAQKLTAWAAAESIDFAAVTGDADAYVDAFLLNCAPAEVEAAKADFKATITVNADGTVTVTAPGDYNVTPTIQGKESLSDSEWHAKTDGDQFFRAVLSL